MARRRDADAVGWPLARAVALRGGDDGAGAARVASSASYAPAAGFEFDASPPGDALDGEAGDGACGAAGGLGGSALEMQAVGLDGDEGPAPGEGRA